MNTHHPEPRREQIISPEVLDGLIQRSDSKGLWKISQHLLALGAFGFIAFTEFWNIPTPLRVALGLAYSILLVFSFCPLHETIHGSAFASKWLNRWVSNVYGLVLMLPPKFFNAFHMAHHRHTQIPGKDPELASAKPATIGQYLLYVSGILYWRAQIVGLILYSMGRSDSFIPNSRHWQIIFEARLFLVIYGGILTWSVATQSLLFFWIWLLPALIGQPFLRLFLLAEHTHCPEVANMFENTRTTYTNRIMQWLCWNMNFHTAHHAYAGIPFYQLAQANLLIKNHLIHADQGYISVHRSILARLNRHSSTSTA